MVKPDAALMVPADLSVTTQPETGKLRITIGRDDLGDSNAPLSARTPRGAVPITEMAAEGERLPMVEAAGGGASDDRTPGVAGIPSLQASSSDVAAETVQGVAAAEPPSDARTPGVAGIPAPQGGEAASSDSPDTGKATDDPYPDPQSYACKEEVNEEKMEACKKAIDSAPWRAGQAAPAAASRVASLPDYKDIKKGAYVLVRGMLVRWNDQVWRYIWG